MIGDWALILGASSGFGEASGLALAASGMNVAGVHLDRRATLPNVERIQADIRKAGGEALFFNVNAADEARRAEVVAALKDKLAGRPLRVLLHSLAFGTLRLFVAPDPKEGMSKQQLEMTIDVMANSLVYWVQDLYHAKLLGRGSRVFAMTSAGGARVWPSYGAVSAAKSALESHVRQLAVELAPHGVAVNAVRAGVTDTPSLRKIPGHEEMIRIATERNPVKRITTPEDVGRAVAALAQAPEWMTGNVIGVDGCEFIL
jgi:NAD(P)-dependent dehydrogenase (short-subunit alcohol dehydrogenase family)